MADDPAGASLAGPASAAAERRSQKGPDPLIGRVINDRFRIVSLIARGGMGKVYRAEQAPLGREVALKVLNPNYSGDADPEFHKRFFLEASTCSKLSHPNTVTIFDYGRTDDDVYYIAMELLEGVTLHRLLRDEGHLSAERTMHVARQICRSLREAHRLGVIHRDLKPANIFMMKHGDERDFVKVLDFGLVKDLEEAEDLTQTGLFMGSPKYMSPEQIRGEKVDARADVYALGVICYEMLTGKVPFDRPNSVNILMAHVHEPPPPMRETNPDVEVPEELERLVLGTLAKNPDERYASMDDLLLGLKQLASDTGLAITRSTNLGISGEIGSTGGFSAVTGSFPPSSTTGATAALELELGSIPPPADPSQSKLAMPLVMGAIGALALVGAGLVAYYAGPSAVETESTRDAADATAGDVRRGATDRDRDDVVAPDPSGPSATTEDPVEAVIHSTMIVLRSSPAGATVHVGDTEHGPTPADVEWTGEEAARGRRVTFLFRLAGHRDYSVTRVITADRLEVDATLVPLRRQARPRRPRDENDGTSGPVKGYKLDPY